MLTNSVGFTGTRTLRPHDYRTINRIIDTLPEHAIVITGGCIGVDAYVAKRAHALGLYVHVVLPADHSRVDPHWREHCGSYTQMPAGTTYKQRNEKIVAMSVQLHAFPAYPKDDPSSTRSGTWQTIRLALEARRPTQIHTLSEGTDETLVYE